MSKTDLATAAAGGKPATKNPAVTKAKGQVAEMAGKLANQGKRFKVMREHAGDAGLELLRTVETQGTALVMGAAEGYFGEDKMKIGGKVRWRGVTGLALKGWGVVAKLNGKSGDHQAAFGDGLMAADMVSIGLDVGRTYAEKKGAPAPAPAAVPSPDAAKPPAVQGLAGPLREIADDGLDMSGPDDDMAGRGGFMNARREARVQRNNRLVRVRVL